MGKLILSVALLIALSVNAQKQKCSQLKIGGTYVIYGPKPDNPMEKQAKATVRVTRIKAGWVEYQWHYEYRNKNKAVFYRECSEFIALQNKNM